MLTLVFNTTTKEVKVSKDNTILHKFSNVPTVKPHEEGYYEVIQEIPDSATSKRVPVARLPIDNTLMLIEI
jgi:hypothetical protein